MLLSFTVIMLQIQKMLFKELKIGGTIPKLNMNRLVKGNSKLSKNILIFDTTAGKEGTCVMNCKNCYAKKAQRLYKYSRLFRAINTYLAKNHIDILENLIVNQILRTENLSVIRLHSSGDFFSQDYVEMWDRIIKRFAYIKFYTYTKNFNLDFSEIEKNKNFNLIRSLITINDNLVINYGDKNHIEMLVKNGCFLCPATIKENDKVVCGEDCSYCVTGKKVCFNIH